MAAGQRLRINIRCDPHHTDQHGDDEFVMGVPKSLQQAHVPTKAESMSHIQQLVQKYTEWLEQKESTEFKFVKDEPQSEDDEDEDEDEDESEAAERDGDNDNKGEVTRDEDEDASGSGGERPPASDEEQYPDDNVVRPGYVIVFPAGTDNVSDRT